MKPVWNPEAYARNSAAQWQWARELLFRLALQGSEPLLDLGCGDGKITAELARAVPRGRAVGIDASPEMIGFAQQTHPPAQYPNLAFRRLDMRALDYQQEFEVVFSNAALHWVDDHRAVLAGANRALRPGGRLVLSCGGRGNAAGVLDVFQTLRRRPEWQRYFEAMPTPYYFYGTEEYAPWLAETGFLPRRLELVPKDMLHAGPEGLAGWIRTTWMPLTQRVPEAKRETFIHALGQAYLDRFPADSDGMVRVKMVRLEVEAQKASG